MRVLGENDKGYYCSHSFLLKIIGGFVIETFIAQYIKSEHRIKYRKILNKDWFLCEE